LNSLEIHSDAQPNLASDLLEKLNPEGEMRKSFLSIFAVVFFVASLSASARAETFYAYLTGAQEVPAVATTATGYARVVINESTGSLTFTVVFTGLSSTQTASHIHAPGALGATAGVAINFGAVGGTAGTITGTTTVTPTQLSQIRQHLGYVNVHSTNFAGGEIRGQLGIKRPVDFDGDGRQDYSVLRFPDIAPPGVAPMTWWNLNSTAGPQNVVPSFAADANTDFPAPGDYDGDGKDDYSIFRAGPSAGAQSAFWIMRSSDSTVQYYAWGLFGDAPVARDYDGDGITDVAVFRKGSIATAPTFWFIRNSSTGGARVDIFGLTGNGTTSFDNPIPGDYDGDGKFDLAVYRFGQAPANNYIVKRSSDGIITFQQFGNFNSDYILPGDYDGDGKYDMAVARTGGTPTSPMVWWITNSSTNTVRVQQWGITSDLPVQGDYDGDARTDIAVYRRGATTTANSTFWVFRSFDNTAQNTVWGLQPDFPVASFDAR
jgi:hypothetical protein